MKNYHPKKLFTVLSVFAFLLNAAYAQEQPPAPGAPKSVNVPAVKEKKLKNNLTVAVVERKNVPVVTVQLLVKSGALSEAANKAGLANLTASLLTKGTKSRTATEIAEQMEFLGGSINTGAGWNSSVVSINVMSDKLNEALPIMADVVLNPDFKQSELDLLKSQALDGLTYNLKQPGFLANYVASRYSFDEHPAGGTPESLNSITREDIAKFYQTAFVPDNAVLIFTGEVSAAQAEALSEKFFGKWMGKFAKSSVAQATASIADKTNQPVRRLLVVDLPQSGQASVNYTKSSYGLGRGDQGFYSASVLNSVLGGGYSSRLNQEIRIKRGLSYGAGSSFAWRDQRANFGTRTQTKNESAAVVAELVLAEIKRLTEGDITATELVSRKSVLTGNFGRNLETTDGLAAAVADLYSFNIAPSALNAYMTNVEAVKDASIRDFAKSNLLGGDLVIVGDYSIFKEDLAKRFPNTPVTVVKAAELDLSSRDLRKAK